MLLSCFLASSPKKLIRISSEKDCDGAGRFHNKNLKIELRLADINNGRTRRGSWKQWKINENDEWSANNTKEIQETTHMMTILELRHYICAGRGSEIHYNCKILQKTEWSLYSHACSLSEGVKCIHWSFLHPKHISDPNTAFHKILKDRMGDTCAIVRWEMQTPDL